jgi:AcrR family transcriptional regulator
VRAEEPPIATKLPRALRRDQLLDTALRLVREEGTDALTLGHLALRAGVSKPIAYEHFGSRQGLLMALCERIDAAQVVALREALRLTPQRLDEVALVLARAHMRCHSAIGPEGQAIAAALQGDAATEAFHERLLDGYAGFYGEVLAPFALLPPDELHRRCVAIVGAAEALAKAMTRGRLDEPTAASTLASLLVAWLSPADPASKPG